MIQLDASRCTACGLCSQVCPRRVLETALHDGALRTTIVEERRALCLGCGQCALVCRHQALQVDGLAPEAYAELPPEPLDPAALLQLFARRRSVRRYRDQPVPREILTRIVEAVRYAPPASGRPQVGVIVVDDPELLGRISRGCYALYSRLGEGLRNPFARFFIRRRIGARVLGQLESFVLPAMRWYSRWYQNGEGDELRRDSPALLLFHAPRAEACSDESCLIAALYAVLMAETLGVGTLINGLVPPGCNKSPELRQLLQLPPEREVYSCLCLGYPRIRYSRTLRRPLAEVRFLEPPGG